MEEKELTPEESLALIQNMILKARKQFTDNSFHFLLWGFIVAVAGLLHYYLAEYTTYEKPYIGWMITIPGGIVSAIKGSMDSKKRTDHKHEHMQYAWLWMSLGISMFIVAFNQEAINHQVVPIIMLLAAVGTITSGAMMRFWPLKAGAVCFWVLSIVAFQTEVNTQMLLMAVSVVVGYLIPGFMMKKSSRNNVV